ncbi:ATP-binding cassette domain-containing protein [Plantactinospora sp. B6F1]|uniref:ATP-binding cassette domain-containing protein n=1 Tax=Plantactinospora sp. B6F1 TaxID=3158971 RepID=UPI0032D99E36
MDPEIAVCCADLHKRFGANEALRGVDLEIPSGTVHGLLGPNGAGKTTLVRILATLTRPDRGRARVAGYDVVRDADQVRYRIGLAGQHASVDERLSGRANLRMFGRLYHLPDRVARRRADELLDQYDLADAADRSVGTYSGGMLRRLHLLASLIVAPPVLFMDEPTTGLDPRSRGEIWDTIRDLAAAGTTVLLTTQYLEEADRLADHITVIDTGRAIASGGPDELKAAVGSRIDVVVQDVAALAGAASVLAAIAGGDPEIDADERRVSVPARQGAVTLTELVRELDRAGVVAEDIALRRPTLDEVFLTLTGRPTEAEVTVA